MIFNKSLSYKKKRLACANRFFSKSNNLKLSISGISYLAGAAGGGVGNGLRGIIPWRSDVL